VLIVQDLTKEYFQRPVLRDISFALHPGEVTGLVGSNGAGKSTLIKAILGLTDVQAGTISIDGAEPGSMAARRVTAYVPELPLLYTDLTAWEHLRYVGMLHGLAPDAFAQRAEALLRSLQLWEDRHLDPLEMSKGMKQKLSLAAALLSTPRLLLLDEPFSGLDPLASRALQALLRDAQCGGATILMSTHMLDIAERVCDRFLMLYGERLVGDGTAADLRRQADQAPEAPMEDVFAALCTGGVRA